jgi:hypothetical protein
MLEKLEFKKIRAFGEIINDTFLFIRQNFRPLLKVFVYLCGFFILAGMFAGIMYQLGVKTTLNNPGGSSSFSKLNQVFTFNYFLVIVFSICSYVAIMVTTLSFIALYMEKGKVAPTPEEVWAYFKYYYFRVFLSSIFTLLFISLGFVFCLIPGIYLFPAMSLFFPIMILENTDFGYAFSRSFKLLRNQWWTTAGAIFVIWVIAYAGLSFASVPAMILTMVGTFLPGLENWSQIMIIIGTIIQYLSQVFLMIPVIGIALCYFNLTEVQESPGLMDRINQFGVGKTNAPGLEEY